MIAPSPTPQRTPATVPPARIALLGCGTVGREVAAQILSLPEPAGVELVKVLVRDPARPRQLPARALPLLTPSFDDVLRAKPDVVVELLGGLDPAADLIARALSAGIPVATANKTIIAHHGPNIAQLARAAGADLAYEGTVCAGLPVLAALAQLRADRIRHIRGIVSGSCNYILTRLAAGVPFDRAVAEAHSRGLVEPDPSADLSGRDCAEKACILAAAAGFPGLLPEDVDLEGIDRLTADDLAAARRTGHTVKLLIELDLDGDAPRARVGPTLLPLHHPLASVHGEDNAVIISAALAGDIYLRGRGAGPAPTASAVLGDVARLLGRELRSAPAGASRPAPHRGEHRREYTVRAAGVPVSPAAVFAALERHNIVARDIAIGRTGAHVLTGAVTADCARACARSLSPAAEDGLAIPVLGAEA